VSLRTRIHRAGYSSTSAWLRALCSLGILVISLGTVSAADPASSGDAVVEGGDVAANPQSLSVSKPLSIAQAVPSPEAPTVEGCPVTVLPTDGGTSINERAPNSNFRFGRAVYLITAAEAAVNGLVSGTVPSAIGWHYSTAPGVIATGSLIVYLQNTVDSTNLKSTTWATAITGMSIVHNSASTTLPNTTVPFDIAFTGGSPFTYTGGGLYVAFDWQWAGPTTTAAVVVCNTALVNGLKGAQSSVSAPTTTTSSNFRPETRLTPPVATVLYDAGVDFVISHGSLAQPLVGPQIVQAVITNKGAQALFNLPVTFNLTGAETFADTQTVAVLSTVCGGQTTVTFAPFTPSAIGSDTVTVSVPPDDVAGNNSKNRPLNETFNLYSYKHPGTTAAGGVGLTDATGTIVSKFTITAAAKISAVNLEFFATSATTYRVAIYPDSAGLPGLVPLYLDAADRTVTVAGPVTITLPSPVAVGPGTFYAGIQQTNTTNAALSFDNETPIRSDAFFLATPNPPDSWSDFAPGNNFKPNIGVTLMQCATAAECNDNNACTDDACTNQLCVHTNNNETSCDGNSCSNPDRCLNGHCKPGPNPCFDSNACTIDLCDGQGGCIYNAVDCNDNNPCTDDSCSPVGGCAHSNNTGACSDNNRCTIGDVCGGGACVTGTVALPSPVQFCNAAGIAILDSVAPTIASPYPSTISVANQASYLCSVTVNLNGITHAIPDDIDVLLEHLAGPSAIIMSDAGASAVASNVNLTLSDGAPNPIPAIMVSGAFKPTNLVGGGTEAWPAPAPVPPAAPGSALATFIGRNPNGPWNLWVVDDFAGESGTMSGWCVNLVSVCAADADCNDGNGCTSDACVNSQCTHTNTSNCNDGNPCTANNCNPTTGLCEYPPMVCNDNNTCTDDGCNPATGCVFTPDNNNTCSDNSLCTSPDVCQNAVCVGQNPSVCTPDANVCTTEVCLPATGLCGSTNNTNSCDDGNGCTTGEVCGPRFAENFDSVTAPALPAGWTSGVTGTGNPWTTVSTSSDTAPNSAFGFDGPVVADEVLVTPPIAIVSTSAKLTFRNRWGFEGTTTPFDGSVLEIAIAGGVFTDIVAAGGSFVSGGYTGVISGDFGNPLAGRSAWVLLSAGYPAYLTTVVNLPAAAAGTTIQLQWRVGTDDSTGAAGQNIDSIVLLDGATNTCNPGTPITAPPETQNVTAANKTTYNWSAAAFATRYDVVRGGTSALPVGPGGSDEVCFDNLPGTSLIDSTVPPLGTAFWYLARGENGCGNGTYGTRSNGSPRITTTCP